MNYKLVQRMKQSNNDDSNSDTTNSNVNVNESKTRKQQMMLPMRKEDYGAQHNIVREVFEQESK